MYYQGHTMLNKQLSRSNRDLRITNYQDQLEMPASHNDPEEVYPDPSKWDNLVQSNMIIGDVDQFFLNRDNDRLEQDILLLIDELQEEKRVGKAQEQVEALIGENHKLRRTATNLVGMAKRQCQIIRQNCRMSQLLVKLLKVKEKTSGQLLRQLEQSNQRIVELGEGTQELKLQLESSQFLEKQYRSALVEIETARNDNFWTKVDQKIQETITQTDNKELIDVESETDFLFQVEAATQIQKRRLSYEKFQSFSPVNGMKKSEEKKIEKVSVQIQADMISFEEGSAQTGRLQLTEAGTSTDFVPKNEAGVQFQPVSLGLFRVESVVVEPDELVLDEQKPMQQAATETVEVEQEEKEVQPVLSSSFYTQTVDHRMLPGGQIQGTGIQTENSVRMRLVPQNMKEIINLKKRKTIMKVVHQFSLMIECENEDKHQTQITEEDQPPTQQIHFIGNQTDHTIVSYFKRISAANNDVQYDDQVIEGLEKMGEHSQISKAFARLLREHKYLTVCLQKCLERDHQSQEENNERIMELYQEFKGQGQVQGEEKRRTTQQKKEQCIIY